ncbi:MAG TPA: DUF2723 domain-containing protein [Thermoanaerobaculia bacterium]|nr:DUF2723 domain-containing protein [Thermoanaerobaculia bacterium]
MIPSNPLPSPARGRGAGGEGLLALAAAVVALLIRLPFTLNRMWDHDSVQFALGVEKYDLAAHQPHPPGYPLWIGILKVLAALGVDSLHGMVVLAVLGGAIGTGWMVLLVGRLVSEEDRLRAGLFAAALYAFDPLLWFYGELPLIYALEGGLTVVLAWAATRMEEGRRPFLLACGLFALAGGLRQSTMVLLAPLLLFGVWRTWRRGRLTPGLFFGGAALGAAVVLAWFLPLCVAAGGYGAYRRINAEHFATLLPQTSILYGAGWGALAHNVEVLTKWGLQGIVPGAVALLVLWIATPRKIVPGLRRLASQAPWILVWAGPPVLFFALFHITKAGYTLVHLPALLTAIALAAAPALGAGRGRAVLATVVAVAAGAGLFLFGADRRPDQPRLLAIVRHEHNRGTLERYVRDLDRTLAAIRRYPPGETVLATVELEGTGPSGAEGFLYAWHRHLQWYCPEYPVLLLVPEQGFALVGEGHGPFVREEGRIEVPASTRRIVFVLSGPTGERLPLGPGRIERTGEDFYVLTVPFRGEMRAGSLVLSPHPRPLSRERERGAG